jgi:ribosomal protein L24E
MTKLEGMTNDQMPLWRQPCRLHSLVSQATRLPLQFIRHSLASPKPGVGGCFVISAVAILMLISQMCSTALAQAQSPNMIGRWNVEISFGDGSQRALGFDAQDGGKGTLLVLDPKLKVWGPGKPSEAKWTREDQNSVTFTGPVEFMLGNVGRDAGMLICKGKFESADSITGEVEFAPLVGERPSKHGTFKATRTQ